MYSADGNFTTGTVGGYKAFPPIPAIQDVANQRGPGYGRWAATSDKEFRLTFYSVMWKAGIVNGYQRVQETLVFSDSGDEYTGHAHVDFLDANWNVVFSTPSDEGDFRRIQAGCVTTAVRKPVQIEIPQKGCARPGTDGGDPETGLWQIVFRRSGVVRQKRPVRTARRFARCH